MSAIDTIVHCAGCPKGDDVKARTLARAASDDGVRLVVFISVVGADRVPVVSPVDRAMFGYFDAKRTRASRRPTYLGGVPGRAVREDGPMIEIERPETVAA